MQDSNTATEPGSNPNPAVGDPNDRAPAPTWPNRPKDDAAIAGIVDADPLGSLVHTLEGAVDPRPTDETGSGDAPDEPQGQLSEADRSIGKWPMRHELALVLTEIGFERDRQLEAYSTTEDDAHTEFDWAMRRQTYEMRLGADVGEPAYDTTKDSLVKLAAICVAQLEALGRRRRPLDSIRETIDDSPSLRNGFRDVIEQRVDRDGFRVTREFVRADLPSISIFIRAGHLPVSRAELATMSEESWRQVVRDAAAPALDKLTEREIYEHDHLSEPSGRVQREAEQA